MDRDAIAEWVQSGKLPDSEVFYQAFITPENLFDSAEGVFWDFKDSWPFSLSDEYFGGIARLICAFANTYGGIIVFGVHDSKRTGGHNKVRINLDRFQKAIEQLLGALPETELRSYASEKYGSVDTLLIRKRPQGKPPFRFTRRIGKYSEGVIWMRVGHEVKVAEPSQYPILFCHAAATDTAESQLDGSLPPSPATLKQRFVGRTEVMRQLFAWLETSDEPRTYLHGKGGSGKTTIGYEFARLLKEYGGNLSVYGGDKLDFVIFISAKEKSLHVYDGKIIDTETRDFSNEEELLRSILRFGGWTSDINYLADASLDELRNDVRSFFDLNSCVIVIDDIDTLTTKGIDPGSDFLYRTLCRSTRNSKVLYTLRNAPSQSLINAIEVPGLEGDDYTKFIDECVKHFNVQPPSADFKHNVLPTVSERRPLVIESIIALRRTAGSYERAVQLFEQQSGDAIREYVFLREWEALSDNLPRLLLAALSEFKNPATFSELQSVLQVDPSRIRDALAAVREMFLQVDDAGSDTLFSLSSLTKSFVESRRSQLKGYNELRVRAKTFQRDAAISNPRVAAIASKIDRILPTRFTEYPPEKVSEAKRLVFDSTLPHSVTEDPLFRVVRGYVRCCTQRPTLTEIREDFLYAISMKFEPDFKYLRAWDNAERGSGVHDGRRISIADFVLQGKRYSEDERLEMLGRKASSLYARAQDRLYTDTSDAMKDLQEALELHLRGFRLRCLSGDMRAEKSERYASNAAATLFYRNRPIATAEILL